MSVFTIHAKGRLKERYGIKDEDERNIIGAKLFSVKQYKIVHIDKDHEVREIEYKGKTIQAVVTENKIVTFIPPTFVETEYFRKINKQATIYDKVEYMQSKLDNLKYKLFDKNIIVSIIYLLKMRKTKKRG